MEESALDKRYVLWQLFNMVAQLIHKIRKRELDKYGISPRKIHLLRVALLLGEEATLTDLSNEMYMETHSVAALLSRMERDGFVKKYKDKVRKNLVHVEVTEKGKQFYETKIC